MERSTPTIEMSNCCEPVRLNTSFPNFAIQSQTAAGSWASVRIVLQLSDSTALKSDTRLELIIFSDGASPVPVLSELPVLAKNSKICSKKIVRTGHVELLFQLRKLCVDLRGWGCVFGSYLEPCQNYLKGVMVLNVCAICFRLILSFNKV